MNIKPVNDRVVIKQVENEAKTPSGLILGDSSKDNTPRGVIMAVSEKSKFKVGEKVIYASMGIEIMEQGEKYMLLPESAIMAKF